MSDKRKEGILKALDTKMDRRGFVKCSAFLGGSLAAATYLGRFAQAAVGQDWHILDIGDAYVHYLPENQIYSVCQQCNTNCGIKVKFVDGLVAKIDGNPYSPWTMTPQIPYKTPIAEAATVEGSLCPKGQAGIQALYDPYRLVKVLKRAGKRGENKWQTIPFDQAISEIVNGGNLFGEGNVEGLKDICILKDSKIAKELAEDAEQVAVKKMELAAFKEKHQDNLKYLIDPDHPDLGPKNNQFCFSWGRLKAGRGEILKRLVAALGSVNAHGHTTVCQGSLYFTCKAMSDQYVEGKFTGGSKFYWQADTGNAAFILFVGANPYEANYGPPLRAQKVTENIVDGTMRIAVVDPRCSKTACPGLEVAAHKVKRGGRPGHGADAVDHREPALRRPLSGQRQQSRGHGRQRTYLDPGRLAGENQPGRRARGFSPGLGYRPPQGKAPQERREATGNSTLSWSSKTASQSPLTPTARPRPWRVTSWWMLK